MACEIYTVVKPALRWDINVYYVNRSNELRLELSVSSHASCMIIPVRAFLPEPVLPIDKYADIYIFPFRVAGKNCLLSLSIFLVGKLVS